MPHSTRKTVLLICSFVSCCAAIILASVALATRYWITQEYYSTSTITLNNTNHEPITLNAGLFVMECNNPMFGVDPYRKMKDAYNEYNEFMSFGLWISTILFIGLGMVFGVVSTVFAAVNSATTPIEEITGITGLYLWNGLACLFSLISIFLWVGQYCGYLVHIMWSMKFIDPSMDASVTTQEPSYLGYSFYLMCGTAFLYLINGGMVYMASPNYNQSKTEVKDMEDVTPDGMIMLY